MLCNKRVKHESCGGAAEVRTSMVGLMAGADGEILHMPWLMVVCR